MSVELTTDVNYTNSASQSIDVTVNEVETGNSETKTAVPDGTITYELTNLEGNVDYQYTVDIELNDTQNSTTPEVNGIDLAVPGSKTLNSQNRNLTEVTWDEDVIDYGVAVTEPHEYELILESVNGRTAVVEPTSFRYSPRLERSKDATVGVEPYHWLEDNTFLGADATIKVDGDVAVTGEVKGIETPEEGDEYTLDIHSDGKVLSGRAINLSVQNELIGDVFGEIIDEYNTVDADFGDFKGSEDETLTNVYETINGDYKVSPGSSSGTVECYEVGPEAINVNVLYVKCYAPTSSDTIEVKIDDGVNTYTETVENHDHEFGHWHQINPDGLSDSYYDITFTLNNRATLHDWRSIQNCQIFRDVCECGHSGHDSKYEDNIYFYYSSTEGIQLDDTEAVSADDATASDEITGTTEIDVTQSVKAWVTDGKANNGWVLDPTGSDDWSFTSSEGTTPPKLTINYNDGNTETIQEGVDSYSDTSDTIIGIDSPSTDYSTQDPLTISTDNSTNGYTQGLLIFDNIVGGGSNQVPAGATIDSATLELDTTDRGSGADFHRMLTSWTDTDTWSTFGSDVDGIPEVNKTKSVEETSNGYKPTQKSVWIPIDDDYESTYGGTETVVGNTVDGRAISTTNENTRSLEDFRDTGVSLPAWEIWARVALKTDNGAGTAEYMIEMESSNEQYTGSIDTAGLDSEVYEWRKIVDYTQNSDFRYDFKYVGKSVSDTPEIRGVNSTDDDVYFGEFVAISGDDADNNWSYEFSEDLVNGHLNRPALYHQGYVEFETYDLPENLLSAKVDATITGTTDVLDGWGPVQTSDPNEWDFENLPNSTDNTDVIVNAGTSHTARVYLSGYGERDTDTPRIGYNGQELTQISTTSTYTSLPIVYDKDITDNILAAASDLVRDTRYTFRFEGDTVKSFERGRYESDVEIQSETKTTERTIDGVYKSVEVIGIGGVTSGVIESADAPEFVDDHKEIRTQDVETKSQAIAVAEEFLREHSEIEYKGSVKTVPTFAPLGEEIPGDQFTHGKAMIIESADYSKQSTSIRFGRIEDISDKLISLEETTSDTNKRVTK